MPKLLIACAHPGLIRGGQRHPPFAVHELDAFNRAQMEEMLREPSLSLAIGEPLTLESLHAEDEGDKGDGVAAKVAKTTKTKA